MPRRKLTPSSTLGLVDDFIGDQNVEDARYGSITATGKNSMRTHSNHITSLFRKHSILPMDNSIDEAKNGSVEGTSRDKYIKNNGNDVTEARKTKNAPLQRSVTRQEIDIALVPRSESSLNSCEDDSDDHIGGKHRQPKNKLSMKPNLTRFTSYPFGSSRSYSHNGRKLKFQKSNSADDFRSLRSAIKRSSPERKRLSSYSSMLAISQVGLTI